MCYCPGLQSEERLHQDYHKRVTHGIVYKGFRKEKNIAHVLSLKP
jgi:hypothetical protein